MTKLATPTLTTYGTANTSSFNQSWDSVTNASSYTLAYSTDQSNWTEVTGITNTYKQVIGLTSGTTYYVKVKAVGNGTTYTDSDYSSLNEIKVKLSAPQFSLSATSSSITASWSAVNGAVSYTLAYSTDQSTWTEESVSGTSKTLTGLTSGATYYFKLKANGKNVSSGDYDSSSSGYGSILSKTTYSGELSAPTLSFTSTPNSITAAWSAVSNAVSYTLAYTDDDPASASAEWTEVSVSGTSKTLTGLAPGTTYYFKAKSVGDETSYLSSAYSSVVSQATDAAETLSPPTNLTFDIGDNEIEVSWDSVSNASSYKLVHSADQTEWKEVSASGTSATMAYLLPGTTYYVKVMAIGDGTTYLDSAYSSLSSVTTSSPTLTAPTLSALTGTTTSLTASWSAVTDAVSYKLAYSTDQTNWTEESVSGTSKTLTGLAPNTRYYVKVKAIGDGSTNSDSAYSTASRYSTPPNPPTLTLTAAAGSVTASWTSTANAASYTLAYSTNQSTWTEVSVSGTSKTLTGLIPETTYYFKVKSVGATLYSDSEYSSVSSQATPAAAILAAPTFSLSATATSLTASWSAVTGAASYKLSYSTDETNWTEVSVSDTSKTLTGLTPGTTYYIKVKSLGDNSAYVDSAYSSAVSQATNSLPSLSVPTLSLSSASGDITASWEAVSNASSYTLAYSTNQSTWTEESVSGTSKTLTGLTAGAAYYVKVKAVGDGTSYSDSSYSSVSSLYKLSAPGNLSASASADTSQSSAVLTWTASPNASSYIILLSDDSAFTDPEELTASASPLTLSNLTPHQVYYVKVKAVGDGTATADSALSYSTSFTSASIPCAVPGNLTLAATETSVTASWGAVTHASSYTLAYSTNQSEWTEVSVSGTSKTITGLTTGTTYYFKVKSVGDETSYLSSAYSSVSSKMTPIKLSTPVVTVSSRTATSITLSWSAIAHATHYHVTFTKNGVVTSYNPTGTSLSLTNLSRNTSFSITTTARDSEGDYLESDGCVTTASTFADNGYSLWKVTTAYATAKDDPSIYDEPLFMARIVHAEDSERILLPSDVSTVTLTLNKYSPSHFTGQVTRTPVTGWNGISISKGNCLFETLQPGGAWTTDETGCQFIFMPSSATGTFFPTEDNYEVVFTLTLTTGRRVYLVYYLDVE